MAARKEFLDEFDLLDDVARGPRADVGPQDVQPVHVLEVRPRVALGQLHRVDALGLGLALDLVFALVGIVGQVAHIGDVLDVRDVVAQVPQVPDDDVERDVTLGVADVGVAVNGRAADVHADVRRVEGLEPHLVAVERVVDVQVVRF